MKLSKIEIIETLNLACAELGEVNKRDILLSYGVASTLYGLRKVTEDIDAYVPQALFDLIKEQSDEIVLLPPCGRHGKTEQATWKGIDWFLNNRDTQPKVIIMYGYSVVTKTQLIYDRLDMGREKDARDLNSLRAEIRLLPQADRDRAYAMLQTYQGTATSIFTSKR